MNKTIIQLRKDCLTAYRIACVICCAIVVGSFSLHIRQSVALLVIIIVGMAAFTLIFLRYSKLIGRRLFYISALLMDPDLIKKEAGLVYPDISAYWKHQFTRKYYEITRLDLLGDYGEALSVCEGMPAQSGYSRNYKARCNMIFNLRLERLNKAGEYLNEVIDQSKRNNLNKYRCKHILGVYFLEKGDVRRARENFAQALSAMQYPVDLLAINFDLARLEEKEGNPDIAMEHYRQAAALGPKTFLGQEAARRAEALERKHE